MYDESARKTQEQGDEEGLVDRVLDDVITRGGKVEDAECNQEEAGDDHEHRGDESTNKCLQQNN